MATVVGLLALAALLVGLGALEGWGLLQALGYALVSTIALAWLWSWQSVRGLWLRPRPPALRAQVGSHVEERIELENVSWLPKLWLELLDAGDHPEHNVSQVLSLGPKARRARRIRTLCRQRGSFRLGPVSVAGGDPFGLFPRERPALAPTNLLVYPAMVPLPDLELLEGELQGRARRGERVHHATPNVAGLRDYQSGDAFNRIHWPSSLRQSRLMVKECERDPLSDVWLILDLEREAQVGYGPDSTEEVGVTVCASLARHILMQDRAVGILAGGRALASDRGARQQDRMLEFLALVRPAPQPLDEQLLANERRFGRHEGLVIITPTREHGWVGLCRHQALRGIRTSVVLLEAASFGPSPPQDALVAKLRASGFQVYVVRRGARLAEALARPVLGARR